MREGKEKRKGIVGGLGKKERDCGREGQNKRYKEWKRMKKGNVWE